ncbi:hypothetical protein AADZ86_00905 [Colwelliaceae bacterium BS250]
MNMKYLIFSILIISVTNTAHATDAVIFSAQQESKQVEVVVEGKGLAFSEQMLDTVRKVKSGQVPFTENDLNTYIATKSPLKFGYPNESVNKLNESYEKLLKRYQELESAVDERNNVSISKIKNSPEYIGAYQRNEQLKKEYDVTYPHIEENLNNIDNLKERQRELELKIIKLHDVRAIKINAYLDKHVKDDPKIGLRGDSPQYANLGDNTVYLGNTLDFAPMKVTLSARQCPKERSNTLILDLMSSHKVCASVGMSGPDHLKGDSKYRAIELDGAIELVEYVIEYKGSPVRVKRERGEPKPESIDNPRYSLSKKIGDQERIISKTIRKLRDEGVIYTLNLIRDYNNSNREISKYERKLTDTSNDKTVDIKADAEYKSLTDDYMYSLRDYLLSVSQYVNNEGMVKAFTIDNWQFELPPEYDQFSFFVHIIASPSEYSFGSYQDTQGSNNTVVIHQQKNKLAYGFDADYDDDMYIFATLLYLINSV